MTIKAYEVDVIFRWGKSYQYNLALQPGRSKFTVRLEVEEGGMSGDEIHEVLDEAAYSILETLLKIRTITAYSVAAYCGMTKAKIFASGVRAN